MTILHFIERSIIVSRTVMMAVLLILAAESMLFSVMRTIHRTAVVLFNLQERSALLFLPLSVFAGMEVPETNEVFPQKMISVPVLFSRGHIGDNRLIHCDRLWWDSL